LLNGFAHQIRLGGLQTQIGLQSFFRGFGRQGLLSKLLALLISARRLFRFASF